MSEKKQSVVGDIISVLSKNKCTVAEAKWILNAAGNAILEQTTVQMPENISCCAYELSDRPFSEVLARLGITRNDRPAGFQER